MSAAAAAALVPHPAVPARPRTLAATARRDGARLTLGFAIEGEVGDVVVPLAAGGNFRDGLWRHTCCEAFVAAAPEAGYCEFNLSPSGEWAAYAFDGYRAGMRALSGRPVVSLAWRAAPGRLVLEGVLDLGATLLPAAAPWRLALCVVIERQDGGREYWALGHPAEHPDFHHAGGFALTLAA